MRKYGLTSNSETLNQFLVNPESPPITFYDSDRFKTDGKPIEWHHGVSLFPVQPPVHVIFTVANAEIHCTDDTTKNEHIGMRLMRQKAVELCTMHFGNVRYISHDGSLHKHRPMQSYFSGIHEEIELCIDFQWMHTQICAPRLPSSTGHIRELSSGFPADPWRLCLSLPDIERWKNHRGWHDHIVFRNGKFYIDSILNKVT